MDAPKKIWLQRPCRDPENEWCGGVTWCEDQQNDDDTEYVRADLLRNNDGEAKTRFYECLGDQEPDPLERLRFFCSLAMTGQDWLDVEEFFDAIKTPNAEISRPREAD